MHQQSPYIRGNNVLLQRYWSIVIVVVIAILKRFMTHKIYIYHMEGKRKADSTPTRVCHHINRKVWLLHTKIIMGAEKPLRLPQFCGMTSAGQTQGNPGCVVTSPSAGSALFTEAASETRAVWHRIDIYLHNACCKQTNPSGSQICAFSALHWRLDQETQHFPKQVKAWWVSQCS